MPFSSAWTPCAPSVAEMNRRASVVGRAVSLQDRIDAVRRQVQSPGQLALDLSGGAATAANQSGNGEPCGQSWISRDKTCRKGQGAASSADRPNEARRSKPKETILFPEPIVGPSGAKLTAYTWQWTLTEDVDHRGEPVEKRVSDWEKSIASVETGRNVVHQFHVDVDGETRTVSAESALKLMGFLSDTDRKAFGSLKSSARTVARLRMAQQEVQQRAKRLEEDWQHVTQLKQPGITAGEWKPDPEHPEYEDREWQMGDSVESEKRIRGRRHHSDDEMRSQVRGAWLNSQMMGRGWGEGRRWWRYTRERDSLRRDQDELARRLAKAEAKLMTMAQLDHAGKVDSLNARIDALRRKCSTGYGCGAACISLRKECRTNPSSAIGKQRLKRLMEIAAGGASKQRGIAPLRAAEATALAGQLRQRRAERAQQLKGQRAEAGLIPTALPFTDAMAARIRKGIEERTATTGTVSYDGKDLAAAMLKVAQTPEGENMRKALAFMEEAGILVNINANLADEVKRITGKPASELPWTRPLELAKFVREAGLVSDERLEWLRRDQTQAGRAMLRKAEIIRNPPKPSSEEKTYKKNYEDLKAIYKEKEEEYERSVRDGWRSPEQKKDVLWSANLQASNTRKRYLAYRDDRLNEIKWAALEFINGDTIGLSSSENGGSYMAYQKKYNAVSGDDKSWAGVYRVNAEQIEFANMQGIYSKHLTEYLPDKLVGVEDNFRNYDLLNGPIGFGKGFTRAEQALNIHIHELGHAVDNFADVIVRKASDMESRTADGAWSGATKQVLSHGVSWHNHKNHRPEAVLRSLSQRRGPSEYSLTNDNELFAESFASWVVAPKALKQHHPDLYAWVDDRFTKARHTMAKHGHLRFEEER
jgi:hypothetical protein